MNDDELTTENDVTLKTESGDAILSEELLKRSGYKEVPATEEVLPPIKDDQHEVEEVPQTQEGGGVTLTNDFQPESVTRPPV